MDRRQLLQWLGVSVVTGGYVCRHHDSNALEKAIIRNHAYISAAKNATGQFSIHTFNDLGQIVQSFDVPQRGHSFATKRLENTKSNDVVLAIGRRPANYFFALNFSGHGNSLHTVKAQKNRRFYGHAAFHTSNELAYLTENNLTTGQGVIGIYDIKQQFKRIGEFSSHGVGPHDIIFDAKRQCLVVANGGIHTHPSSGRKKLNLPSMRSSLSFINASTGELMNDQYLPESFRYNSIRHLTLDKQGNVYVSLQNQKKGSQQALLAIYHYQRDTLTVCDIPAEIQSQLNRYVGDITLDSSESIFAATSPRGNKVLIYNTQGVFLASYSLEDVCGVSKTEIANEFMLTTGKGTILKLRYNSSNSSCINIEKRKYFYKGLAWDNHLIKL